MDAKEALTKFTGIGNKDIDAIWETVKANHKKLEECERPHDFVPHGIGPFRKEMCSKCGGVVNAINAMYYRQGLADAKKGENGAKRSGNEHTETEG